MPKSIDIRLKLLEAKIAAAIGTLFIITAVVVLGVDFIQWLKTAKSMETTTWVPFEALGIPHPYFPDWRGFQKIVDWMLNIPLWTSSGIIGLLAVWYSIAVGKHAKDEMEWQQMLERHKKISEIHDYCDEE